MVIRTKDSIFSGFIEMKRRSIIQSAFAGLLTFFAFRQASAASADTTDLRATHAYKKNSRTVRRLVTGQNSLGKSIVASDSLVEAITLSLSPGFEMYDLWGADEPPTFPTDGTKPTVAMHFPPVCGFRFGVLTLPSDSVKPAKDVNLEMGMAEMERKLPGVASHMDPDGSGMHRTDSVDFQYVISGEAWLELDDGRQVHVRPGDSIVQNGTHHAWHNKAKVPCRMVICLIGANRRAS